MAQLRSHHVPAVICWLLVWYSGPKGYTACPLCLLGCSTVQKPQVFDVLCSLAPLNQCMKSQTRNWTLQESPAFLSHLSTFFSGYKWIFCHLSWKIDLKRCCKFKCHYLNLTTFTRASWQGTSLPCTDFFIFNALIEYIWFHVTNELNWIELNWMFVMPYGHVAVPPFFLCVLKGFESSFVSCLFSAHIKKKKI